MRSGKDDALEGVNSIMARFMSTLDYSKVEKNETIQSVWKKVVPNNFSEKTKALNKTDDGTLFIACENSLVTNELFMQKQEILLKINEFLDVSNIVFTHKAWKNNN